MKRGAAVFHDSWKAYLPGRRDTVGSGGTIRGKAGMYDEIDVVPIKSLGVTPVPPKEVDDFHE